MSQNSQHGALNWLAGQVRVLLKRMANLENGSSKVPIALDSLIVSSPVTVQGGRTDIYGQIAPVFSEYIAPQPAACYATSVPIAFAATAPVVERVSPDFAGYAVPVPVVESSCRVRRTRLCGEIHRCRGMLFLRILQSTSHQTCVLL